MYLFYRMILTLIKWCWFILNCIREIILNILLLFFIITIIFIYSNTQKTIPIVKKGALILNISGNIVDKPVKYIQSNEIRKKIFQTTDNKLKENSLFDIIDILRQAKKDSNITGLVLLLKNFSGADQPSLQYIGQELNNFRNSGKPIYAIGSSYSQAQYFLASYANKIFLTPQGIVDLHGFATSNFYYKKLLEKLKIKSHIFRIGTYKSAVEPFIRNNMSIDARNSESNWLNQLWQNYIEIVSSNRKIKKEIFFPNVKTILNKLQEVKGNAAKFALNNNWVDEIASVSKINKILVNIFGWNKQDKTFNNVNFYNYKLIKKLNKGPKIDIIFVNGAIINGMNQSGTINADNIAYQIHNSSLDPNTKALILRVNSPGGSVSASETIRSELESFHNTKKPIIVSMGGIAASGGYWISTPANYIIASNSTLTGSIGIFGIVNTLEKTLDSIGIHTDGVSTSTLAGTDITKKLPYDFSKIIQLNIENGYQNFINLVAKSRHKTIKEVDKISQGHIWTGSDALKNGLIDKIGNFDDAVTKAVELAHLDKYYLNFNYNETKLLDFLLMQINSSITCNLIKLLIPNNFIEILHLFNQDENLNFYWNDPKNIYALCLNYKQILIK